MREQHGWVGAGERKGWRNKSPEREGGSGPGAGPRGGPRGGASQEYTF